jgi:hypothetical protein
MPRISKPYAQGQRYWNDFSSEIRNSSSLSSLKCKLKHNLKCPNYFYIGNWKLQVLTYGFVLSIILYSEENVSVVRTMLLWFLLKLCTISFFICPLYNEIRESYMNTIPNSCALSLQTILYGDCNMSDKTNCHIFPAVYEYTNKSKRFS